MPNITIHYLPNPTGTVNLNYDITNAITYARQRYYQEYKDRYVGALGESMCTVYVMDILTSPYGGNWDPKTNGLDYTSDVIRTSRNHPEFYFAPSMIAFMQQQPDAWVSEVYSISQFDASLFEPGDVVVQDQLGFYNHAVFVASVDLATDVVNILEMSGSSNPPEGREFRDVKHDPINYFRIIRIDEYYEK